MTEPLLIAINGRFYRPIPDGNVSYGEPAHTVALKVYLDKPITYYDYLGKRQGTINPSDWGYAYPKTDPASGRKYVLIRGDNWVAVNGELFVLRGLGTNAWLKASEYDLIED